MTDDDRVQLLAKMRQLRSTIMTEEPIDPTRLFEARGLLYEAELALVDLMREREELPPRAQLLACVHAWDSWANHPTLGGLENAKDLTRRLMTPGGTRDV